MFSCLLTQLPFHLLPLPIQVQGCYVVSFLRNKELCRTASAYLVRKNTRPCVSEAICNASRSRNMLKIHPPHTESSIAEILIGCRNPSEGNRAFEYSPSCPNQRIPSYQGRPVYSALGACPRHHG
ncbi:hypothetical protein BDW67DRAFT_158408 [Aspergillus spinulosporus]